MQNRSRLVNLLIALPIALVATVLVVFMTNQDRPQKKQVLEHFAVKDSRGDLIYLRNVNDDRADALLKAGADALYPPSWIAERIIPVDEGTQLTKGSYIMYGVTNYRTIRNSAGEHVSIQRASDGKPVQFHRFKVFRLSPDDVTSNMFSSPVCADNLVSAGKELFEILPIYKRYDLARPNEPVAVRVVLIKVEAAKTCIQPLANN